MLPVASIERKTCQWDSMGKLSQFRGYWWANLPFGCFQKIVGFPPKSSIFIGFSLINHPFWGTPIFLETPIWWTRNMDNATCAEPMFAASSSSSSNVEARLAVEDTGSDRFDIAKSREASQLWNPNVPKQGISPKRFQSKATATTKLHCPLP